jgi:hypothetical protein
MNDDRGRNHIKVGQYTNRIGMSAFIELVRGNEDWHREKDTPHRLCFVNGQAIRKPLAEN